MLRVCYKYVEKDIKKIDIFPDFFYTFVPLLEMEHILYKYLKIKNL